MSWEFALGLLIIINIASEILTKIASDKLPKKALGIFYQYLFCSALTIFYFFFARNNFDFSIVLVAALGFVNAFGNYCQWQAFNISLSKSVIFFPFMEAWAIFLAVSFLGESSLWNLRIILGVGLCFLAMWLFRFAAKRNSEEKNIRNRRWILFVLGMIFIFGTAAFLLKLFSSSVPRGNFLMGWYLGAFLASYLMLKAGRQKIARLPRKIILTVFLLSLTTIGALFALYWTYQLGGTVSLVQPLRGFSITLIPAIIGWFSFKERRGLSRTEWLAFLSGIAGAILILLK